jgi:spore germination protein
LLSDKGKFFSKALLTRTVAALALIGAVAWGIYENRQHAAYELQLENMYTRSYYELVDNVDNIEVKLSKLMVSGSPGNNVQLLSDISRQAESANDKLTLLPVNHPALSNTVGLITLTGDYCRSLALKASEGHPLNADDINALKKLYDNCTSVSTELRTMQTEGKVSFTDAAGKSYYEMTGKDGLSTRFSEREKSGVEYPSLIYDGPFSESLNQATPKGLPAGMMDANGATAEAGSFLGLSDTSSIKVNGVNQGQVQAYDVQATSKAGTPVNLLISCQGGKVLQMIEESGPANATMSVEDCLKSSQDWLTSIGMPQMAPTFLQQYDGQLVINFAPTQDNAVLYPDLVKVKVRMDDGHVCAYDSLGYWMNHTNRPTLQPQIPEADARKLLSPQLQVTGVQLALTPMPGGGEQLCWEYKGTNGADSFIVYIDAVTGVEAQIFKIVPTDNGNLVV